MVVTAIAIVRVAAAVVSIMTVVAREGEVIPVLTDDKKTTN